MILFPKVHVFCVRHFLSVFSNAIPIDRPLMLFRLDINVNAIFLLIDLNN